MGWISTVRLNYNRNQMAPKETNLKIAYGPPYDATSSYLD